MVQMEYVASGTNYLFMTHKELYTQEHGENRAFKFMKEACEHLNRDHHKLSFLFNAYQEQKHGPLIADNFSDVIHGVHADSGGLQIISLGREITPELKDEVYRTQAANATVGMSFDEIPVKAAKASITDMSGRMFDVDNYEEKARETGRNLARQIQIFKETGTECRPFAIMQGNCLHTYQRWCELVIEQVPEEDRDYIGGVAMGFAGLGYGELEGIKAAYYVTQLPFKFKAVHFLGVGSIKRLFPVIALRSNGKYDGLHLSYDSTSQTSGPNWGNYYVDDSLGSMNIYRDNTGKFRENNLWIYNDIKKNLPMFDLTFDEYIEGISRYGLSEYDEPDAGGIQKKWIRLISWQAHILSSIMNFSNMFDDLSNDFSKAKTYMSDNEIQAYSALRHVDTPTQFDKWLTTFSKMFQSKGVPRSDKETKGSIDISETGKGHTFDPKIAEAKKRRNKAKKTIEQQTPGLNNFFGA